MAQFQGTVLWFNNARGYGFVTRENGPDLFVHYTSIHAEGHRTLHQGERVEYDVVEGAQGPLADAVVRVEDGQ